ncbi:MAG: TlpA family protein disulfide reductase [Sterolibacterium sp.]|jgi:thiol-disulfide isomerase/thioredoxin|nr:TlpA family protein disulfide reductase [Sterolibacterium sp.]
MKSRWKTILLTAMLPLLLVLCVGGFAAWPESPPPLSATAAHAARQLVSLTLPDVQGREQALQQWQGKLRVVNLWATWCSPCRAEMPGFSRLQEKYAAKNVQFIGIALDTPDQVADYTARIPVRYPLLMGTSALLPIVAELGNLGGAVPYTFILGQQGELRWTHTGYWSESALDAVLIELLGKS